MRENMETIWDFGIYLNALIQGLGNWLLMPMNFFSFLGTEEFVMFILPLLYWNLNSLVGLQVSLILVVGNGLNDAFKVLFHDPRPYWYSAKAIAYAADPSFGLPSNHAQTAVSFWGLLAYGFNKRWLWIVSIAFMFFIGLSRLYLGVHFPTDVLAGWLIGAVLLFLFIILWKPVTSWFKKQPAGLQIFYSFLASILLMGISVVARLLIDGWTIPEIWLANALATFPAGPQPDPLAMAGVITSGGVLFGFMAGLVWMNGQGSFSISGQTWQLVVRYLMGLVGVLIIYIGLKTIFPQGENFVAYVFRFIRYTLVGSWVTAGAPWLFIRLRLMEKAK
jgi:membrane-associated phospholipid phosphatase